MRGAGPGSLTVAGRSGAVTSTLNVNVNVDVDVDVDAPVMVAALVSRNDTVDVVDTVDRCDRRMGAGETSSVLRV